VLLQLVGGVGALLTGGAVVMLLGTAAAVLAARPRPRGWIIGAGVLAGLGLFVLPWSLFVSDQIRAAGSDPGAWASSVGSTAVLGLGASAWLLWSQPRGSFALDVTRARGLAGGVTLVAGLLAAGVGIAAGASGRNPALGVALLVGAWVLLRTLRVAEPGRHLADVVVASVLLGCLVWWVFVGTIQGTTGGVGMLAVVSIVFLAQVGRAGKAADEVPATRAQPKRPEM
jgi:hypothetical protein